MRAFTARRGCHSCGSRIQSSSGLSIARRRLRLCALAGTGLLALTPTLAQETVTYTYDSKGRLVTVNHGSTGPNAGVNATYTYDNADNRTNVTVSGVAPPSTCVGVSFATGNASANEGSNLSFTVTKSGTTSDTCTVSYATANGTALSGTNYTAKSGTLSFASGTSSQSVTVTTIDDHVVTGALTMKLNLSSPSGSATITTAQGIGTINNIDTNGTTAIQLTSSATGVNLLTFAQNNGYSISSSSNYQFVIGTGVNIVGAAGSGIGVDTGSWPQGATLSLQVNGTVSGGGGNGGAGGGVSGASLVNPTGGGAGGDGISCGSPISITINRGGKVYAGGGAGGGASYQGEGTGGQGPGGYTQVDPGGGGGGGAPNGSGGAGGAGYNTTSGSSGSSGTSTGGGAGGSSFYAGGNGGTYAAAGSAGATQKVTGGAGGAAGYGVRKNGTGCTVTNSGTIAGLVG